MSAKDNLVPTVITNKNGVITTVYRKPGKTESASLAPVVLGDDKSVYTLSKVLTERIKQFDNVHYEYLWRKRAIKEAVAANDAVTLERLDKFFHLKGEIFRETIDTIELSGLDRNDEKMFQLVSDFMILSPKYGGAEMLESFVQLLADEPERLEEIAHYRNMIATSEHVPTMDEIIPLMEAPHVPSPDLPPFLAETVKVSNTPVSDYNLVAKTITNNEPWYTYIYFGDWDRQSMSYMAGLIRENKFPREIAKVINTRRLSRREATELAAMASSVSDLLGHGSIGYEPHLRGPNGFHIVHALEGVNDMRSSFSVTTPIETEEDLAMYSAQLRFTLTINDLKAQRLENFIDPDSGVLQLLRDHSSESEVRSIVNLFNERGVIDVELAREHLRDQSAAPLNNGWL